MVSMARPPAQEIRMENPDRSHAMEMIGRALILACMLLYVPAQAQTLDFESTVYQADRSLIDTDGWTVFRDVDNSLPVSFRIQAEAGNRFLRCQTAKTSILFRDFPAVTGILSLSWRWRATGDGVHLCLGVARKLDLPGFDPRSLACIDPYATLESQGGQAARASKETWVKQKWYYMRMVMDAAANTSILYIADKETREDERVAVSSMPMNDVGPLTRLVLVNTDGTSPLDLDDISWQPVATWIGGAADSNWSTAANWSSKTVPDSNTRVVFDGTSSRNCFVDNQAFAGVLEAAAGFKGSLNLGASTLAVMGKADFTGGGAYAYLPGGQIRFSGGGIRTLTGPDGLRRLPPIRHDGSGTLRLLGRSLSASGFLQTRGSFDFNGFDLGVTGDLTIQNGNPGSIVNLDGRSITVTGAARFEGTSKDTLLSLDASSPLAIGWSISVPTADNLSARFAVIGRSKAAAADGQAIQSIDAGLNIGWLFAEAPVIVASPRDTAVMSGQPVSFKVSASGRLPLTYQWLRNAVEIPGAKDSTYSLPAARRADGGAGFACRVSSAAGNAVSETARLVVDFPAPGISPAPQVFADSLPLYLIPPVPGAVILFSVNGSDFRPYDGILVLRESALVKAFAISGPDSSAIGSWSFPKKAVVNPKPVFPLPGTMVTLGAGESISLSEKYAFLGPAAGTGTAAVALTVLSGDSLNSIQGFGGIQFAVRLSAPAGASGFPKVRFTAPADEARHLYRLDPGAMVHFVSEGGAEIRAPGIYFLGLDTLPPRIELVSETFVGDSTRAVFAIRDNVSDLSLDLSRTDDPALGFSGRAIGNPESLVVVLKSPPGPIRPFALRLEASDGARRVSFPPEPGALHCLSRSIPGSARTPSLFRIGDDPANPWDLIAFPIAADPPLTLARLRQDNSLPELQAATWDDSSGRYRFLKEQEALLPGSSVWFGSLSGKLSSLSFASLKTAPRLTEETYKITLRKGWNQVANPTLATLYWPVSRMSGPGYAASLLKGLHCYDAATGGYRHSDSLEPWRGYFAYYKGDRDTVVELRYAPIPAPDAMAKSGAARGIEGIDIRLSLDYAEVNLGAAAFASDGIGFEDESRPPAFGSRTPKLTTTRAGRSLETDLMHWKPGSAYAWKVVAGLPVEGNAKAAGVAATPQARVEKLDLPAGYSAWAVSRNRGLRFRLGEGDVIPLVAGFTDSLDVLAAPAAELDARLASIPITAGAFKAAISTASGGFIFDLSLPFAARIRWTLWTLDGRRMETGGQTLPVGIYHLRNDRGGRGYASGTYVLGLEWSAPGFSPWGPTSGILNRKVAIQ
ncbi:MAG: hypothetical protein JWO30_827 [Fibrobacteres bacterium]|nr:hypothetical protein [Fibrobacterota bacterium]